MADLDFTKHIRSRGEEGRSLKDDPTRHARRWILERIHSWINRYRGMLVRWSKKTANHAALLKFSLTLITWQQAGILNN